MSDKYMLVNGEAVLCPNLMIWARWFETAGAERVLRQDDIGDVHVSTVFLGLDHAFGGGLPVLWETMIFKGPHDGYQARYTSRADAIRGHEAALALVRSAVPSREPAP